MTGEPEGYDDPISDEASDLLGRAGFARELAVLAISGPPGWSTRIGLYGEWGEGKTSVLRLAKSLLEGDGHFVVEFNPWGCSSASEMVELLAKEILKVGKREKLAVPGRVRRLIKWSAGAVGVLAGKAQGVPLGAAAVPVAAAGKVSPWLKRWAKDRKKDIEDVLELLSDDRRLVVLVDDVDRLDPKLLPSLMFALHEAFALPGLTFVVALDPQVVGSALHAYHPGFGDGLAFLEKIVQFPRWLPPISASQRFGIAEADRQRHVPFLNPSTLELNQALLPKNPREVRMLVRGLLPLARAFSRHDPDELDQTLLILLECIRQRFPRTLAAMLDDGALLDSAPAAFVGEGSSEKFVARVIAAAQRVGELPAAGSEGLRERLEQLAGAFCGRSVFWNAANIRYHAHLIDRPHAVTWREVRPVLEHAFADATALDSWIIAHSSTVGASPEEVALQLFDCALRSQEKANAAAADSALVANQEKMHAQIAAATATTRLLWFSSRFAIKVRTPERFKLVVQTFRRWSHFTLNANDRTARARERELLVEVVGAFKDPIQLVDELAPWEPNGRDEHAADLTDAIGAVLTTRSAPGVIALFGEHSGIASALRSERIARRYVLALPDPTWTAERRAQLEKLSDTRPDVVAENLRMFLDVVLSDEGVRPGARELLNDRPLMELMWRLLCLVRWQPRFLSGIEKLKRSMERGAALPEPAWWAEIKALRENKPPADPAQEEEQ